MVEVVDVVMNRKVECALALGMRAAEAIGKIATKMQIPSDTFFLISESGEVLSSDSATPKVCFLFRREELIIDDRDLTIECDWHAFTRYPPGDWYTEAFDYDRHEEFTNPRISAIPNLEKRLFKCQQEAKRVYATYKLSLDRFKKLEYSAVWRVKAAIAIVKKTNKDLKCLEGVYTNIRIDPLPATVTSTYKEKLKCLLQLPSLQPSQVSLCQLLLKQDLSKCYLDCKNKLEGKLNKSLTLISRLSDAVRKTKTTVKNREGAIAYFFESKAKSDMLGKEPLLAVAVASVRTEYTRFRDLLSKLFASNGSSGKYCDIAKVLSSDFTDSIASFESELTNIEPLVNAMKEAEKAAATECERGRGAFMQAFDNAATAVARLKIQVVNRQGKIASIRARLERYHNLLLLPEKLLGIASEQRQGNDGGVPMHEKLLEVCQTLGREQQRAAVVTGEIHTEFEKLRNTIETEKEARSLFLETHGNLLFSALFPALLPYKKNKVVTESRPTEHSSLFNARKAELQSAFRREQERIFSEVDTLERSVMNLTLALTRSQDLAARLEFDKLSQSQLHSFSLKQRLMAYTSEYRRLSECQGDYLESANTLSRYR